MRLVKVWTSINMVLIIWKSEYIRKNKTGYYPSCGSFNTAVWIDHLDANKTYGEKNIRELPKNITSCFEQILEATLHKQPVYSQLPVISKTIQVRQTSHTGLGSKKKRRINA